MCVNCGFYNQDLTLKIREWTCPDCNTFHDRDVNAAINIKKFALIDQNLIMINSPVERSVELVDLRTMVGGMKQEAT
ncbi:hypothetical protein BGV40_09785 [Methanosarcina sp. Ant1]|nr:hypothetical protein BGV40_09785 [Methanosarcina sp. Ant1]